MSEAAFIFHRVKNAEAFLNVVGRTPGGIKALHLLCGGYERRSSLYAFSLRLGHKMAVLGDMRELGAESEAEHRKVLQQLADADIERLWLVGAEFRQAARETGFTRPGLEFFPDVEAVKAQLAADPVRGFIILIKGSNSLRLYELSELF